MDNVLTQLQIQQWIEARDFGSLKAALCDVEIHELAELLSSLENEEELAIAFRVLPTEPAAEILGQLEPDQQEDLLTKLSTEKVAAIINEMPPDDRTGLLEELPGRLAQKLMNQLAGDERKIAMDLLAYPEDSIGRRMTPEYIAVRKDWSINHVLRHIRKVAQDRETFNVLYVIDNHWKLLDEIYLEDIVLAEPDQTVADLMDEQGGYLLAGDDQEAAVEEFRKYDAVALPVVDSRHTLVGIVTFDDVMDVQEEETTEDMQKMSAVATFESSYFRTPFWAMIGKRLPWLLLLLVAETGAVLVLKGFEQLLVVLAMFMPLINAAAGNTGSQVAGLMIRGFAVQEIDLVDWSRVFFRELARGLLMGIMMALAAGVIVMIFDRSNEIVFAVSIAMVMAVTLANVIGSMLPFFFKRVGVDPAVTSGPFISALMDIFSILIFFTIASSVLNIAS
ncbi:MAG: magnesium transporter [Phycisphaerae bacterium]|nr:magnesium transporter [Phycisphaerae bacterium]